MKQVINFGKSRKTYFCFFKNILFLANNLRSRLHTTVNNGSSFAEADTYDNNGKKNRQNYKFRKIFLLIIAVTVHNIPGKLMNFQV